MGKEGDVIDQDEIKAACEDTLTESCLRDEKRFLLRLLEQKRKGNGNTLIFDLIFGGGRKTAIPDDWTGNLSSVAKDMVRVVLQSVASKKEYAIVNSSWHKQLDELLYDQWGYKRGVGQKVYKDDIRRNNYGVIEVVVAIREWAKITAKMLSSDAEQMERKIVDLVMETKSFCDEDSDGYFNRRCEIINQLVGYDENAAFSTNYYYRVLCKEKHRLTIARLTHDDGMAELIKEDAHLDHLADWKITRSAGHPCAIVPKVVNLSMIGIVSNGTASLLLTKSKSDGTWALCKHKKEDRYAIINVDYDAPLTCNRENPLSADLQFHCGEKHNDIGIWLVTRSGSI